MTPQSPVLCALAFTCLMTIPVVAQQGKAEPLSERELIIHTLSRLTFGVNADLVQEVESLGLDKWLDQQFKNQGLSNGCSQRLKKLKSIGLTSQQIYQQYANNNKRRNLVGQELNASILLRGIYNNWQAAEVMAEFWRNHFNVDRAKDSVRYTATDYERSVLRNHVFGRFHDMLESSAKHPAMLVYLDNYISRKPPTKTALKTVARNVRRKTGSKERGQEAADIAAQRGLNENYARELMELHTLGVDNGYTQRDVVEVARALTGWTVNRDKELYEFAYKEDMHDGGDKFVLGRSVPREKKRNGIVEGEKIIARLAKHKNTSQFLAKKLCTFLLADDPPQKFCDKIALELRKSQFDLGVIVRKIVDSEEFRKRRYYRGKFKTPLEFVLSALRATGAEVTSTLELTRWLEDMGQPIYRCEDPTGYADTAESWRDPGVMAVRWRFALDLVYGRIKGIRVPESFFANLDDRRPATLIKKLGDRVVPGGLRPQTISTLLRVAAREKAAIAEARELRELALLEGKKLKKLKPRPPLKRRLLAVLLGAPEFQQQ